MKRRMIKYFASFVIIIVFISGLTGCNSKNNSTQFNENQSNEAQADENTEAETDNAAVPQFSFSLAHHHSVDSITDHMCNNFADLVKAKTNGAVEITVYPASEVCYEIEVSDGLLNGAQEFGVITAAGCYVDIVDGFGADMLPFMFSDWDEINYAFNEATTPLGPVLNEKLIPYGARILNWVPCGGRQMIFVDKDITSYTQLNGMTMRSPESTLYTEMFKALGAAPTPITWSECYTAMQTKVADGMEAPISSIKDMNFVEVTKYCLLTNHMWTTITIAANEDVYQSLPPEYQKAIDEAALEAGDQAFEEAKSAESEDMQYCKENGMIFNELSSEDSKAMAELMTNMKETWLKDHPGRQEVFDLCEQAKKEYNNK